MGILAYTDISHPGASMGFFSGHPSRILCMAHRNFVPMFMIFSCTINLGRPNFLHLCTAMQVCYDMECAADESPIHRGGKDRSGMRYTKILKSIQLVATLAQKLVFLDVPGGYRPGYRDAHSSAGSKKPRRGCKLGCQAWIRAIDVTTSSATDIAIRR